MQLKMIQIHLKSNKIVTTKEMQNNIYIFFLKIYNVTNTHINLYQHTRNFLFDFK